MTLNRTHLAEFDQWWSAPEQEELRKSCAKGWAAHVWRASAQAAPEAEPVEVVAYRYTSALRIGGKWHYQETFPKWDDRKVMELGQMDELMTVAQHKRIMAVAPQHDADWREHSKQYAKGEKCPQTIEALQAAWDRDQELMMDQKAEISRLKEKLNRAEQRNKPHDAELIELLNLAADTLDDVCHGSMLEQTIRAKLATLRHV